MRKDLKVVRFILNIRFILSVNTGKFLISVELILKAM